MRNVETTSTSLTTRILPFVGAIAMTVVLVGFLLATRFLGKVEPPDQTIRLMETMEVSMMPPPPPPIEPEEPPPPPKVDLPQLDIQLDSTAPALKATTMPKMEITMQTSDFEMYAETPPPPAPTPKPKAKPSAKPAPVRSTYSAGELDARPRLVNRPSVSYPSSMRRKGSPTGKVLLEVSISTSGRVSVRRVLGSNSSEFTTAARSFASRARFTVPKKNGRAVTAIYKWPIVLKP